MNTPSLVNVPSLRTLPRIYQIFLTLSRRHGLFTLARLHHYFFRNGHIVQLPGGGRLFIPADSHYFGFLCGIHEGHVGNIIDQHLRPGDVCLDVGANIGYFAVMMANRVGSSGRVYAFEPVPETYDILALNAKLAGNSMLNITTIRAAISSNNGELSICRKAHSTLHQVTTASPLSENDSERVPAATLTSALEKLNCTLPISLLKIDVEGHELSVLKGAESLLRSGQIRRMIIEVTPGTDAVAIAVILAGCKASVRCWLDGHWQSTPLDQLPYRTDVLVELPL